MEIVETTVFTRQILNLLSEEEYRCFQSELLANPGRGPVIRGGGGIRKVRVATGSRGKSGGARVIYFWAVRKDTALLLLPLRKERGGGAYAKTNRAVGKNSERGVRK